MVDEADALKAEQLSLACGRIAGGSAAIVEAYDLGVVEGPFGPPWQAEYHREAVKVYSKTLPAPYQLDIAQLFDQCERAMGEGMIPSELAENWTIVRWYLREASRAIIEWIADRKPDQKAIQKSLSSMLSGPPPGIIRFDELATLTTLHGASQLRQAALAVQQHLAPVASIALSDEEQRLLRLLQSGKQISSIAAELMYSERTVYRRLRNLWRKLGVGGRREGLPKAVAEGLLDR